MNYIRQLDEDMWPKANSFNGSAITDGQAKSKYNDKGRGSLQKVEGLVYDVSLPNFNPMEWNHCITRDILGIDLELCAKNFDGKNNNDTYSLHVHRHTNRDTTEFIHACKLIAHSYAGVRSIGWGGVGKMYSAGYNVGFKGLISPVCLLPKERNNKSTRDKICGCLKSMSELFHDEFGDKNIGYNDMILTQKEIWPKNRKCPQGPACWIVSEDLGNPRHVDNDFSRSYAGWFTHTDIDNQSAWFLFPMWGVAIELCNDTWISWHGANCAH